MNQTINQLIKINFIATFMMLWSAQASIAQSLLTLEDIHQQVIDQSYTVQNADNKKAQAQEAHKLYTSLLKPGLTIRADLPNYSKTSSAVIQPDGTVSFQSIKQMNSTISAFASQVIQSTGGTIYANSDLRRFDDLTSNYKQYNGVPIRIGIFQPLFGFNEWKYQKDIQPLLLLEAEKSYSAAVEEALTQATALYFDIIIAQQNLSIAQTNAQVTTQLLTITSEKLNLGKVTKDEKLQLEIELKSAQLAVSQAQAEVLQAKAELQTFLSREYKDINSSYVTPDIQFPETTDITVLLSAFQTNRPQVIAQQRALAEADMRIAEERARYGVKANVKASLGLARGADVVSSIYTDPFDEQQFNVSLEVPIIDWGRRKAAVAQATIRKAELEANLNQEQLSIRNAIEQTSLQCARLQNNIKLLEAIKEKAEQRFIISNERYVLGDIDLTYLTLAQREKDQTQRNYINALRALWLNYYDLRALTGYDIINNRHITY